MVARIKPKSTLPGIEKDALDIEVVGRSYLAP
jgi:hypothetical protein